MTFLYPHILWALVLPVLLAVLVYAARRRTGRGWQKLVSAAHLPELVTRRPAWRTLLPATLCLLALACTILALARPINGFRESGGMTTGRNLLIALDISRSMETQDVKPSRLMQARTAAYELIEALPSDKIGLIVFSGEADMVVPLTYDHTALRDALEQVDRTWAGTGGTNFGLVLQKAMKDFQRSAPDGTNALVILSDGEDTVGSSLDVAEEARKKNLLVITVGVGTPAGAPIPDAKGENGLWQDRDGKHVISKLDAESLRKFSEATGGDFAIMDSRTDISAFAERAVRKLDRHEESFSANKVPNDLFAWFAWAALLMLVLAIATATEWRMRRAVPVLALLLLLSPAAQAAPDAASLLSYTEGLIAQGSDPAKAREAYSRALLDEDPQIQSAAFYQLGNMGARATMDKLRKLYEPDTAAEDDGSGEKDATQVSAAPAAQGPKQPSIQELQGIVDELKKNLMPYEDALKITPSLQKAKANKKKLEQLIKDLEEEIERLKQQQQQDQQKQDNNDQKDDQQKQDNNDQKDDQQKQDGNDQKDDQQKQDGNDKQDDQQKQDGNDKQDDQQKQDGNDKQDDQQKEQQPSPGQMQQAKMTEKDKARQSAADVLRMHLDEEKGSPIPHLPEDKVRTPSKDY